MIDTTTYEPTVTDSGDNITEYHIRDKVSDGQVFERIDQDKE